MKVIDLLNKIENGEEVPKQTKYEGKIYTYKKEFQDYKILDNYGSNWLINKIFDESEDTLHALNDEVEIIEEEKLIFEEINELSVPHKIFYNIDLGEYENSVEHKVNQLIRNQKKIIDKLKKGK